MNHLPPLYLTPTGRMVMGTLALLPERGPANLVAAVLVERYKRRVLRALDAAAGSTEAERLDLVEAYRRLLFSSLSNLLGWVKAAEGGVN